jgi:hypothetical protein
MNDMSPLTDDLHPVEVIPENLKKVSLLGTGHIAFSTFTNSKMAVLYVLN